MVNDDLKWLLKWYYNQCDGDWEHGNGIELSTLDNPGWHLRVSLIETELKHIEFKRVDKESSENDWLTCYIENGHFESFCGPFNLLEVLKIFRSWAENSKN